MIDLKSLIRDVPDFPKPGVLFKDISPLLADPGGLAMIVEQMANPFRGRNIELVCGAESRGFIFGTAIAQALSAGFVPIRKPGKLPGTTRSVSYTLEYGNDSLEIQTSAIARGQRVLLVDDLLATGGTLRACLDLLAELGADVAGVTVAIELSALGGRARVAGSVPIDAAITY